MLLLLNLFTSEQGIVNYIQGKKMFAYRDKSETNCFSISIPVDQTISFSSVGEFVIKERGFSAKITTD